MKKTLIAAMLAASVTAFANPTDFSLSTGDWSSVDGQTLTGTQTFQAGPNAWAISPYTGSTMYSLSPPLSILPVNPEYANSPGASVPGAPLVVERLILIVDPAMTAIT